MVDKTTYVPLLHCDWCGKLMALEEGHTSEYTYSGTGGATLHLCWADRQFVTVADLAVNGQLAKDQAARDEEFGEYIARAINPWTADEVQYPWI